MWHLPVPSELTGTYADSERPAEVFQIPTEINSNGFPGALRESNRQKDGSSEDEANRNVTGERRRG